MLLGHILFAVVLLSWAHWLTRHRIHPRIRHLPPTIVMWTASTTVLSLWGLWQAFAATSAPASERASSLAHGISLSLNTASIGVAVDLLLAVALAALTWRLPRVQTTPL